MLNLSKFFFKTGPALLAGMSKYPYNPFQFLWWGLAVDVDTDAYRFCRVWASRCPLLRRRRLRTRQGMAESPFTPLAAFDSLMRPIKMRNAAILNSSWLAYSRKTSQLFSSRYSKSRTIDPLMSSSRMSASHWWIWLRARSISLSSSSELRIALRNVSFSSWRRDSLLYWRRPSRSILLTMWSRAILRCSRRLYESKSRLKACGR